jgi:hypothetical protein
MVERQISKKNNESKEPIKNLVRSRAKKEKDFEDCYFALKLRDHGKMLVEKFLYRGEVLDKMERGITFTALPAAIGGIIVEIGNLINNDTLWQVGLVVFVGSAFVTFVEIFTFTALFVYEKFKENKSKKE